MLQKKSIEKIYVYFRWIGAITSHFLPVSGRPDPEVKWYHNSAEVITSSKYFVSQDYNLYKLDIRRVDVKDGGEVKCVAINPYGHAATVCSLNILGELPSSHLVLEMSYPRLN